jgi:hypothetical protein
MSATVYQYENRTGNKSFLSTGNYPDFSNLTIGNDSTTSLDVAPWTSLTVYKEKSYGGSSNTFVGPTYVPDLKNFGSGTWNNDISSAKVVHNPPTDTTKTSCCLGTLTGAQNCADYTPNSTSCNSFIGTYCTNPVNITQPICKTWATNNRDLAEPVVKQFCATNPTNPYCSCFSSKATSIPNTNPACVDANCISYGFQSAGMINGAKNCPTVYNCTQYNDIVNAGINLGNSVDVQMNCGNTTVKPPPVGTTTSDGTGVFSTAVEAAQRNWMMIVMIMVFFIFVIVMVVIIVKKVKSGGKNSN